MWAIFFVRRYTLLEKSCHHNRNVISRTSLLASQPTPPQRIFPSPKNKALLTGFGGGGGLTSQNWISTNGKWIDCSLIGFSDQQKHLTIILKDISWIYPPPRITVANKGLLVRIPKPKMSAVILVVTSQHPGWAVDPIYPVSFSHVSFHFNFKNPDSWNISSLLWCSLAKQQSWPTKILFNVNSTMGWVSFFQWQWQTLSCDKVEGRRSHISLIYKWLDYYLTPTSAAEPKGSVNKQSRLYPTHCFMWYAACCRLTC